MSEFTTDTFPNDDDFHPGENLLYSNEQLAPACRLLSEVSGQPEEELWQFISDFREHTHRGDHTLSDARWNAANRESALNTPQEDFTPYHLPPSMALKWARFISAAHYTERVIRVDEIAGEEHEQVTRSLLFEEKSPTYIGDQLAKNIQDLPAFRACVDEGGGPSAVLKSLQKLQLELQTQHDWSFVVQGINLHGGFGLTIASFSNMRNRYVQLAESALRTLRDDDARTRLTKIEAMKQQIAASFSGHEKWDRQDPLLYFLKACERVNGSESTFVLQQRINDNLCKQVPHHIEQAVEQEVAAQRAARAEQLHTEYSQHAAEAVPTLSGKTRKREGYENLWNTLIGRNADPAFTSMLDHDATKVLSMIHLLRQMVAPSFEGVQQAHAWQDEVRVFEQIISDEYATLGRQKELPLKESVARRFDWLRDHWDAVAGQLRNIPEFPVDRVAAALFPEVAATIEQKEQKTEQRQDTVAKRLGSDALEQLVVQEVDWEILPIEHIGERIQQEAQRMTRGKRTDAGRRALQEVRVRDLIEMSTLFDDAVVHVSREKEGITRRKNEPYFVITFTYGDQRFALAENLVLDNATFILPESEFSWQDVFSLPRGAVGEFGARRINHPSVDEAGEYEGGPSTHVNAIFAKLDKALAEEQ